MNTEKTISVLNSFIVINNSRIKRYKTASKDAEESFFKKAFLNFQKTSLTCKKELSSEIIKLGGTPVEEKNIDSLFNTFCSKLTKLLIYKDLNDIIYSCERNENIIIRTYYEAIYNNLGYLTKKHKVMLNDQCFLIKDDHNQMKSIKNISRNTLKTEIGFRKEK